MQKILHRYIQTDDFRIAAAYVYAAKQAMAQHPYFKFSVVSDDPQVRYVARGMSTMSDQAQPYNLPDTNWDVFDKIFTDLTVKETTEIMGVVLSEEIQRTATYADVACMHLNVKDHIVVKPGWAFPQEPIKQLESISIVESLEDAEAASAFAKGLGLRSLEVRTLNSFTPEQQIRICFSNYGVLCLRDPSKLMVPLKVAYPGLISGLPIKAILLRGTEEIDPMTHRFVSPAYNVLYWDNSVSLEQLEHMGAVWKLRGDCNHDFNKFQRQAMSDLPTTSSDQRPSPSV